MPANSQDARLCDALRRNASMPPWPARPTFIVGDWHGVYVHLPIPLAVASRKKIDPESDLWHAVIAATGQPQTWD